ncbi:MAG: membrane protein insertion efficiency factor YidD [Blastocatellia bacterium]|nr:membrane protein insertion efficiency factor YidD [Blastocatellia bacterium]
MSPLRKYIRKPRAWIAAFLFIALLGLADSFRAPSSQLTARLYISGIHLYQKAGRPLLRGVVECRYKPTCSEYSEEAVRKHGIRTGLRLTFKRLSACNPNAPPGTYDPVPDSP